MSVVVDELSIYLQAFGKMTEKGYGVAVTEPEGREGRIFWFRDRRAFVAAGQHAQEYRLSGMDRSELSFADQCEHFPDGDAAVRALLERRGRSEQE